MADKPYGIWAELRILKERTGLKSAELARQANVAKGYLSQLETGARWPTPAVTKKLADALRVPYTVLERQRPADEKIA
jgi:transcriptional regulator with XRE-family HTH domain